jgi:SnoaL-like polyketide cyclase
MFDSVTATREDLEKGLQSAFTVMPPIDMGSPVNADLLQNDKYAAVQWTLTAQHTKPFCGIAPTGRVVVIEGLTIVELPQKDGDEPQFMRFIDWSKVFGQLGVVTNGRSLTRT